MKHHLTLALLATALATPAFAQSPSGDIKTTFLGTLEILLDVPQNVGQRFIVPDKGGTLQGPKIKAEMVPPSGDWLIPMPDGSMRLDVRQSFKTDDGEILFFQVTGVITTTKEVMDRFGKGEVLTPKDEYFMTAATVTTTSKKYEWLSHTIILGKMVTVQNTKAKLDLYTVE